MEIWKDIEGYEGLYQVSNYGRVKSLGNEASRKEKIRKVRFNNDGYPVIYLHKNGEKKFFLIHRLVAQTFIPNPNNLPEINHKDECKTNSFVENLEWCDRLYNINYGNAITKANERRKRTRFFKLVAACCRGLQKVQEKRETH